MIYNKDSYTYKYTECPLDGSVLSQYATNEGDNVFSILEDVDILPFDWIKKKVQDVTDENLEKIIMENSTSYNLSEINGKKYISTVALPKELIRYIEKHKDEMGFDETITEKVSDFVEFLLERDKMLKKLRSRIINVIEDKGYYNEIRLRNDIYDIADTDDMSDMLKNCPLMLGHIKESLWDIMSDYGIIRDNYLNLDYIYGHDYKFNSIGEFYDQFNIRPEYMLQFDNN